jgi:hypothetical protein
MDQNIVNNDLEEILSNRLLAEGLRPLISDRYHE